MLAFALVPLAVGFLLSQTRLGEQGINAVANIGGMVVSFLGGAWVSLDLVGPEVRAVAPFSPSYWATDALDSALASTADMGRIAGDIGIVLVFALVIAIAGVALGRARMQSSAA
jgi:ABC-2 type transport system permease protein